MRKAAWLGVEAFEMLAEDHIKSQVINFIGQQITFWEQSYNMRWLQLGTYDLKILFCCLLKMNSDSNCSQLSTSSGLCKYDLIEQ